MVSLIALKSFGKLQIFAVIAGGHELAGIYLRLVNN
jgi:hypothetical protein